MKLIYLCISSYSCASTLLFALSSVISSSGEELRDIWHHESGSTKVSPLNDQATGQSVGRGLSTNFDSSNKSSNRGPKKVAQPDDLSEEVCDFKGKRFRVAVSPQPPLVNCLQDLYGDWLCNGSNIEVIHVLERRLNFHADWIVLANGNHDDDLVTRSAFSSNRKFMGLGGQQDHRAQADETKSVPQSSGLLNLVATGRVLMSANGVMKTLDRSGQNFLVSEPFDSFNLHFLLSKSVRDHDHIFIKPFSAQAWIAILASAMMVVPIFYLINTTSSYYSILDDEHLRHLSLGLCLKHKFNTFWTNAFAPPRRLSSSTRSSTDLWSLDKELSKIIEANDNKNPDSFDDWRPGSQNRIDLFINRQNSIFPAGVSARKQRRLARRQWARERRRARKLGRMRRKSGFFKVAYIIWYVVASLANQGGETEDLPHANSTRVLVAFWWLYLIVICAIHSGILTAILTFPKQNDFIQTLDDYLNLEPSERDSLRLSVDKYSELAHLLVNFDNLHKSPLQLLQNLSVPISYVNFQRHRQRILDEVQQGKNAFMEEKSTLALIITQEYFDSKQSKCLFKASRYPIDVIPMSLIISKNMSQSCVRAINQTFNRIRKTGLAQKWRRMYGSPGNDCLNTVVINAGDVDKIELKQVIFAFWLLGAGVIIGLLFLIAEIVWLFMIEDEEDDDSSSVSSFDDLFSQSSSCSSTSSESSYDLSPSSDETNRLNLGYRRALMPSSQQLSSIRSLQAKRMPIKKLLNKGKRSYMRSVGPVPKITFTVSGGMNEDDDSDDRDGEDNGGLRTFVFDEFDGFKEIKEIHARHLEERRAHRMARHVRRRAKRLQKTVDLFKRLHGGKIYTGKIKKRMRRMSHSVISHLSIGPHAGHKAETETASKNLDRKLEVGR